MGVGPGGHRRIGLVEHPAGWIGFRQLPGGYPVMDHRVRGEIDHLPGLRGQGVIALHGPGPRHVGIVFELREGRRPRLIRWDVFAAALPGQTIIRDENLPNGHDVVVRAFVALPRRLGSN